MPEPVSDALVFFGATGDLAYKQIFPALQSMIRRDGMDMPIVGVAKSGWTLAQLQARARDSLEKHGGVDEAAFAKLLSRLDYIDGDYRDDATYRALRTKIGSAQRPLHYLAIPPSMFGVVAGGLAKSNCSAGARIVVEKPFGRDLASAQALSATLNEYFAESSIYRIDHYLGKEAVQNLLYFRFANIFIEPIWNRDWVDSIQITMAENFGVSDRGKFYDEVGAIRDVVQNHMLQVVAALTMEPPSAPGAEATRDERVKLLSAVRPLTGSTMVRGQYRGYRQVAGVAPDSNVETFAAMRLEIETPRWQGVPVLIRVGKRLPVTATEVMVYLKREPRCCLGETQPARANYFRFRLTPETVLALAARVKKPGEAMHGDELELFARHQSPDDLAPYERLLTDAMHGDVTLFARQDGVEAAWRVVDPALASPPPVVEYEPGSWGPEAACQLLAPGGAWHNPTP